MEFPAFSSADTLIIVSATRHYRLHSNILASSSSVFAEMINEYTPRKLTKAAEMKGITTRYRFILTLNEGEQRPLEPGAFEQPAYVLERQDLSETGAVIGEHVRPLGDENENGRAVPHFILAWEKVLGAFYNRPIDFGDSEIDGVNALLVNATEIMKIAEYLDCVHIVSSQIEATFLSLGQTLHRSIAAIPAPWISFAYRLRSKKIFKEALIHGTGKYNSDGMQHAIRDNLFVPGVNQLLARKAEFLRALSKKLQTYLISWYPDQLQRAKTVGRADRDSIGRASYANDIISWMALTVFRHWVSQMICNDKTHHAPDMGWEFFRLVSRGGDAYLGKNVLNQFHNYFPMSPKGEGVTENRLTEIKHYARSLVGEAHTNLSLLDTDRFPAGHMTCVPVNPDDYPWLRFEPDPLADIDGIMPVGDSEEEDGNREDQQLDTVPDEEDYQEMSGLDPDGVEE